MAQLEAILEKIKDIVKKEMEGVGPTHDFSHVMRVYNLCIKIANYEKQNVDIDFEVLKLAALLHDIGRLREDLDTTGTIDHAQESAKMAETILKNFGLSHEKIEKIKHAILSHRFRGNNAPKTIEAKILFDADKIDSLGAIGIARAFCYEGEQGGNIFLDVDIQEYIKNNLKGGKNNGKIIDRKKHAANIEFYIKLRHLPNKMFTKKGKEIAKERLAFMESFFSILRDEINGKR